MALTVEIDQKSGFCGGVIRAIGKAEEFLDSGREGTLYSLGAIVHNEAELARLSSKGLVAIDKDGLKDAAGKTVLIRAHGEPPQTYEKAGELGVRLIDCTCPVVLKLQASIREAYTRLHNGSSHGRLIIFGKIGHAEVLGLVGQVGGDALVVENKAMLLDAIKDGKVDFNSPIEVFSQTTKSPSGYAELCELIRQNMANEDLLVVHNTICSQVSSRHAQLRDFSRNHDIIIFVAGHASSNGKVLCELCRSENERTYHIGSTDDIKREWFRENDRVGVCGATSTPKWLLEDVAKKILEG